MYVMNIHLGWWEELLIPGLIIEHERELSLGTEERKLAVVSLNQRGEELPKVSIVQN